MANKKIQNTIKQTLNMYKGPSRRKRTQKLKGKKYNRPKESQGIATLNLRRKSHDPKSDILPRAAKS